MSKLKIISINCSISPDQFFNNGADGYRLINAVFSFNDEKFSVTVCGKEEINIFYKWIESFDIPSIPDNTTEELKSDVRWVRGDN